METENLQSETDSVIEHVVFDLDDTLLDTSRLLIPRATQEACRAMIESGLHASIEDATAACRDRATKSPRQDLFMSLVKKFGVQEGCDPLRVATAGNQAFYNRKVEEDITVFPGVIELLESLKAEGYHIHLVTQGHRPTQEEKIRILNIGRAFESIHHIDPSRGERKRDAFARIMERTGAPASHYISIGNRIDTDISEAKELGWKTCWVRYGEYRFLTPTLPKEKPDFIVSGLSELKTTGQL